MLRILSSNVHHVNMDFEKSSYIFHPSLNKISSNTCLPVYPPAGEQAGSLPVTISIPTLDRS